MVFVGISSLLLLRIAVFIGHVPMTFGQACTILFVNVLGVLPFCAIGLFVGSLVSGQAAPAIVNLIYLPMAFLSGLWFPLPILPKVLQQIAPVWPAHHLAQLALGRGGCAPSVRHAANHVAALAASRCCSSAWRCGASAAAASTCWGRRATASRSRCAARSPRPSCGSPIGLVIAGVMGGNARAMPPTAAATSKDATERNTATAATDAAAPPPRRSAWPRPTRH